MWYNGGARLWTTEVARLVVFSGVTLVLAVACQDAATAPARRASITKVSGDSQVAEVATALAQPIVVRILDSLGAPAAGVVVHFAGAGSTAEDSTLSDARGLASARWTLAPVAGLQFMIARVTIQNRRYEVTFRATAIAAAPSRIVKFTSEDTVALPGTELDTLGVTVFDRFGNPVAATPVSWSVAAGGGTVRPVTSLTDTRGAARAIWTLGPNLGVHALSVRAGADTQSFAASARPAFLAKDVVAGAEHSCALTIDGRAYCWGSNRSGQLGSGRPSATERRTPVAVAGELSFKALAAGATHTCGLTGPGETYCWGGNAAGQLGSAPGRLVNVPTRVVGAPAFGSLVAGRDHTCGLTSGGNVFCWGDNAVGQIGDGSSRHKPVKLNELPQPTPTQVAGAIRFSTIAAADYLTCGASTAGEAYCWGANWERALGSESSGGCFLLQYDFYYYYQLEVEVPCATSPVRVATAHAIRSLSGSGYGMCGVVTTGELLCWGNGAAPSTVPGGRFVQAWRIGTIACGLETSGTVSCWSLSVVPYAAAPPFREGLTLVNLRAGGNHFCGLTRGESGTVHCWGSNLFGQVGDGTKLNRRLPVAVVAPL